MKASVTSEATTPATDGQKKQIVRMFQDAVPFMVDRADLSHEGAQRAIDRGDGMLDEYRDAVRAILLRHGTPNEFADEEVGSNYGYPSGYAVKPIREQIQTLAETLRLDPTRAFEYAEKVLPTLALPDGAEGWFAVPLRTVAPTYNQAVEVILAALAKQRRFRNWREGQLGPDRLRQHARTVQALAKIGETQKGDVLIVAAQFGKRHAGLSVRRAREVMTTREFGLDSVMTGSMLLTHPERLGKCEDLWIDVAGDEFAPGADGQYVNAPYFNFNDDELEFGTFHSVLANDDYGSASGFLLQ